MYSSSPSEFEVQAVAYNNLLEAGYITRGEVKISIPGKRGCRFDLVVFDNDFKPILVIEVKNNPKAPQHTKKAYYELISGLPSIQINGMAEARSVVEAVKRVYA